MPKTTRKRTKKDGERGPLVGPDGKAKPFVASVPEKICDAVDRRAKSEGLTRSAAVTAALREWLAG